mmetsp:Transcript_61829/g.175621  ORF Transcript_61829/g.175621 Transcript_61829/m.175621 type:complete len:281 (+) Transcript_61829:570-1412(+)
MGRRDFLPEFLEADRVTPTPLDVVHELHQRVDEVLPVLLCAALQSGIHENPGDHVQHGQDRKRHVEAQQQRHQRRVLGKERLRQMSPVEAARDGLVQGHHGAQQRPVVFVRVRAHGHGVRVTLREVCHDLGEADARGVGHQNEEDHRPDQGGHGLSDRTDKSAQLLDHTQDPCQPQDAEKTEHPEDAQEAEASGLAAGHESRDLLEDLEGHHDQVEVVPGAARHDEERGPVPQQAQGQLRDEDRGEALGRDLQPHWLTTSAALARRPSGIVGLDAHEHGV